MNVIEEYNEKWIFKEITGIAMDVYNVYRYGLVESAYEAAMVHILEQRKFPVQRQVFAPIFWEDTQLNQVYRLDLLINENVIVELKTVKFISQEHRSQLFHYLNLTHFPYGMLINFSPKGIYSEWNHRDEEGKIERIKLI